jgi:hypothetical protein
MLDRYAEHLAHAAEPKPSAAAVNDRVRATRVEAASNAAFPQCTDEITKEQAACALASTYADEFERCLQ